MEGLTGPRTTSRPSSRAEEEVVAVGLVVVVVVYGGDAPYDLAVALGQEELYPRVLVEGVLLGIELFTLCDEQRGDPVGVVAVPNERVPDKALYVGAGPGGSDPGDAHAA
jgi:hypothetical protein